MQKNKKFFWVSNFIILTAFTSYAFLSVFGAGTSKVYAETLAKDNLYKRGKHFMVVDKKNKEGSLLRQLKVGFSGEQEICMLSNEQVAELDAFYNVDTFKLSVQEKTVLIAAVEDKHLSKQKLLNYLRASDSSLECRIIAHHKIFFFPVLPVVS